MIGSDPTDYTFIYFLLNRIVAMAGLWLCMYIIPMENMLKQIIDQQIQTNSLLSQQNELLMNYFGTAPVDATEPDPLMPDQKPTVLPQHLTVSEVIDYFEVSQATFYRNIKGILIKPVNKVGKRPYYLLSDVEELMKHIPPHEKGAWTFKKLKNKLKDD